MRIGVLLEPAYRRFVTGYGLSYVLYWITLLAFGWWMWDHTASSGWVGLVYFSELAPSIVITPFAAALADRGDRFRILRTVLWAQVATGSGLAAVTAAGLLTPGVLVGFALAEGTVVGFSQPAFFGLLSRIVSPANLPAAVGFNVSVVQSSYVLGPILAGLVFSLGPTVAPLAFAANAVGTAGYIWALSGIALREPGARAVPERPRLLRDTVQGMTVFWTSAVAFRAAALTMAVAALQRPLISLMAAINDRFALLAHAHFTLLTASFTSGGLVAGLVHARRNSDAGQDRATLRVMVALTVGFALFFPLLAALPGQAWIAMTGLFLLGLGCNYVTAGNSIILQARTPDQMRSRVLGNNLMMARAAGALSVLGIGVLADARGFAVAMTVAALGVGLALALALGLRSGRG
jgi:MFS family permease